MTRVASASVIAFPRRTVKKIQTRLRIVGAAGHLFAELGYADATMAAIAQKADVHVTTLFTHFKNKRELAEALAEQSLDYLRNLVSAKQGKLPFFEFYRDLVLRAANAYVNEASDMIDLGQKLRTQPELLPAWLQYERGQIHLFAAYIAHDFGIDLTTDTRPLLVAAMLVTGNILTFEAWLDTDKAADLVARSQASLDAAEALLGRDLIALARPKH